MERSDSTLNGITITGIKNEGIIKDLLKALGLLKEVGNIIIDNHPGNNENCNDNTELYDYMIRIELKHGDLVLEIDKTIQMIISHHLRTIVLG